MSSRALKIFIDGASRGNPGPASVGVVAQDAKGVVIKTLSHRIGTTTNNTAEYSALILALQEALMLGASEVEIFTDSELVARQFNGEYRIKEDSLKLLFLFATHLKKGFKKIVVKHVPREQNKLADAQANRALDNEVFL
ncbi:MAG: ribonuclease HI family protein [Candidatus Omnitrophica bacterium]|nr:ribonuclease HI family protein [Candidatus Omnitrophota bacterium]